MAIFYIIVHYAALYMWCYLVLCKAGGQQV
jgi:hypothetical protein